MNCKLIRLAALAALLGPVAARAQQVLVQANVAEDTVKTTYGPNRRYFAQAYLGYGLVAGPAGAGAAVRYGSTSRELQAGGRFKRRFSQALALTVDARYAHLRYELSQNDQKTVPSAAQHRYESLGLHQLQADLGLRLNVGHRGNVLGRYLDLLAWGGWVAGSSHRTEDAPAPGIGRVETIETGLPYLRRWRSGVGGRVGLGRLALAARYRLSPMFEAGYAAWPELPRWVLGLEVGVF